MKATVRLMLSISLVAALGLTAISIDAQSMQGRRRPEVGNTRGSGSSHSTSGSSTRSARPEVQSRDSGSRGHSGGSGTTTRPDNRGGHGGSGGYSGGGGSTRPDNRGGHGGGGTTTRPDNRGGHGGSGTTTRPDNRGGHGGSGGHSGSGGGSTRPDNRGGYGGSGGHSGHSGGSTRPDNRGGHSGGGHGGYSGHGGGHRPDSYRPGGNHGNHRPHVTHHGGPGHHHPGGHHYRPGAGPRHDWHTPHRPPHRPYRPARIVWHRPHVPHGYRPYYGAPIIDRILGIAFGTLYHTSLDYLFNNGYIIDGYDTDIVYLRDVTIVGTLWPDAMLNYDTARRLSYAQFYYSTAYLDRTRYNRVYRDLCAVYGPPIEVAPGAIATSATWFGGNTTGYVTLSMDMTNGRCYTSLTVGL